MSQAVSLLFWLDETYSELSQIAWSSLQADPVTIQVQSFSNDNKDIDMILNTGENDQIVVIVYDVETEKELAILKEKMLGRLPKHARMIVVSSRSLRDEVKKAMGDRSGSAILQKPLRGNELFLVLEKTILVEYFKNRMDTLGQSEAEWLGKVERVFEFSRQELLEREKTQVAYENLVEYEEHLLDEQRKINQALLRLQEYRDSELLEAEKERAARSNVDAMRTDELRNRDSVVKAQEALLELSRTETMHHHKLLAEFEKKGTLGSEEIQKLFDEHKSLISKIKSLSPG